MHGISTKRWFYQFADVLAARPKQTARILCGPSAEHWLASEMYAYLAGSLPSKFTCYGEDGSTDLTVYPTELDDDGRAHAAWHAGRVASIEIKLVYQRHSEESVRRRVTKLCEQVVRNRRHKARVNVGYIYGIFVRWPGSNFRVREDFSSFRRDCGRAARAACRDMSVPCAKPTLETIIDERVVTVGGVKVNFGLVGQYVLPT